MFPLRGKNENWGAEGQPPLTSHDLNNVRPYDILDNRARGGQRPGLDKQYPKLIGATGKYGKGIYGRGLYGQGSEGVPVTNMCEVTTIKVS